MVRHAQLLPFLLTQLQEIIDKSLHTLFLLFRLSVFLFAVRVEYLVNVVLERMLVVGHCFPVPLTFVNKHVPATVPVGYQGLGHPAVETAQSQGEALVQQLVALEELVGGALDGPVDVKDAEGEVAVILVGNEVGLVLGRHNGLDEGVEVFVIVA